jgi:hypothetical protein
MILSASSSWLLQFIVDKLKLVFAIKDLGPLRYFLGIDVKRDDAGFFLSQEKYATEILDRAGMSNCNPARTPADVRPKASDHDGNLINDASWYRSMAGGSPVPHANQVGYRLWSAAGCAYTCTHHAMRTWRC